VQCVAVKCVALQVVDVVHDLQVDPVMSSSTRLERIDLVFDDSFQEQTRVSFRGASVGWDRYTF